jgi:hypothetical protein
MMIQEATLYRWRGADGKFVLGETAPAGAKDVFELDSNKTVLAWTAQQAAESGFGTMMTSPEVSSLGKLMNASEWVSVGDGAREMLRSQKEIEREDKAAETAKDNTKAAREKIATLADHVASAVVEARKADPKEMKVYVRDTGAMTPDSQLRWRQQSDLALDKWNAVLAALDSLQQAEKKVNSTLDEYNKTEAKAASTRLYKEKWEAVKMPPVDHGLDEAAVKQEATETMTRIRTERVKSRL